MVAVTVKLGCDSFWDDRCSTLNAAATWDIADCVEFITLGGKFEGGGRRGVATLVGGRPSRRGQAADYGRSVNR